ncbi:MAG: amino acid ABC transporter substrate-binding protein [Paludibacteraceae bacterium]
MKLKISLALILGLIALSSMTYAQQSEYPTKTINGIEYYIYTVQTAEGLYSVSKKFGVSQADINNTNPQIQDGLKAGQEILIPKKRNVKKEVTSVPLSDDVKYVLHTVEKRQTLFAISRKYNVTQEAIMQANPLVRDRGIQAGDVLRIPVKKNFPEAPAQQEKSIFRVFSKSKNVEEVTENTLHIGAENNYITHVVESKETLYSISKKYSVTVDEIKSLNPGVKNGLKAGTTVKIPFIPNKTVNPTTTIQTIIKPKPAEKNTYKIAYLLPFMLDSNKADPTVDKFVEFYMGSLLAINNAKNGDMNFEIFTYDIEKTETKVVDVINKPELQKMDLIIGPAYTVQIPVLADFAQRRQINTIIPFSSKVAHIDSNPYVFQFNPDQDLQNDYLVDIIKNRFKGSNIVFVETGNMKWSDEGMDFFNYLIKRLSRQNIAYNKINATEAENISNYLSTVNKNIIIFDTDELKSVQTYLNKLHDLNSKYDLAVLGQYSWRNVSGKKPVMYYVSPFAGNLTATQYYEQEYQKYYNKKQLTTNPRFDLLGYDLTTYFLSTMKKDGFTFKQSNQSLKFNNGVQSDLNFVKTGKNGGYMNQQLYLIEDEAKKN